MPTITQREIDRLNKKVGVYSTLAKPEMTEEQLRFISGHLVREVTKLVKNAFIKYAKAHGCKINALETEMNL